jgi:hypothetical protein
MKLFVPLFLISSVVFGQTEPEEVFEYRIFELGFSYSLPQGDYLKKIRSDFAPENAFGFSGAYLINPLRKKEELSVIFIGGEIGLESNRQSTFSRLGSIDGYYAKHATYTFRAKAKYVPILVSKRFLPSISFAIGPKIFNSKLMDQIDQENVQKVASITKSALSYAIELGIEAKRRDKKYVKLALAFDISNSVKIWDKNKLSLDQDFFVVSPITVAVPQLLVLKAQFVNYR